MQRTLSAILTVVRRFFDVVIILLFSYMAIAVVAQVIGRYVFNYSIAWATETATYAQIWMVLVGAGYAMRRDMHVSIDLVLPLLPRIVRQLVTLLITAMALWFLWVVFQGSFRLIKIGVIQKSPALQIPMLYPYLSLPVGAAYFAFELILHQWNRLKGTDDPDDITSREG
ncbi:TRAP transporter small permease [Oricola thermophila]|uniref:TRAP transporter small permease protein n=1 Tax=Oricola thermophila TaxID=2742145 RepID=A0A6N1VDR4_9HYPH|nr:TRAP transporter small permease [Oricola thermophila]QKV18994.1 TRAP transporter small permease [Oricola thermophila]